MTDRFISRRAVLALLALATGLAVGAFPATSRAADAPQAQGKPIIVFAAASLTDVLGEINTAFKARTGIDVKPSFAASSALARQVESGAQAEVFFSADEEWMDYLAERKLIRPETRRNVVGNRLVLISPADRAVKIDIKPGFALNAALGPNGRLATGDPDSVPVGKYAQAALTKLGVWDSVKARLVRAENVRTALAYVARGEASLGIVYGTDAQAEKRVRIAGTFPEDSHPPIRYPIAATTAATPAGVQYAQFVHSADTRAIFEKHGFEVLN